MDKFLEGKVAIVIGSTAGIGEASALNFGAAGATVIVTGRRKEKGDAVVSKIVEAGGNAEFYKFDVSVLEECEKLVDDIAEKYGRIDILHYNSGVSTMGDEAEGYFENTTERLWDYVMQVNLKSAFFLSRKILPELKKTHGCIVFTSSGSGQSVGLSMHNPVYGISKAGLDHMVRIVAGIAAADGVRVNAIAPGLTKTDIIAQAPADFVAEVEGSIPMKKMAMPEDQANAVLFLASDFAGSITGQILTVDNGQTNY